MKHVALTFAILLGSISASVSAAEICPDPDKSEEILYTWRLRGALAWIAGIAFPTSGTAELLTTNANRRVTTDLMIKGPGSRPDFYRYQSEIDPGLLRTVMSFHSYSWGKKQKEERTLLDYGRGEYRRR